MGIRLIDPIATVICNRNACEYPDFTLAQSPIAIAGCTKVLQDGMALNP